MKNIHDLKIGETIHLLNDKCIIITHIDIVNDLINHFYSQTVVKELSEGKTFITFAEAKKLFKKGIDIWYFTGEYTDGTNPGEMPFLALASPLNKHYGDSIEDLENNVQYFI